MYSELVYFEGAHFAHIVAYEELKRLRRITATAVAHFRMPGARAYRR